MASRMGGAGMSTRMATVIQMQKPRCEQISQMDLCEYRIAVKELRLWRQCLRERRQEIMTKLAGGSTVEDGPMEAVLLTVKRGTKSIVRLVVRV